MEDGKEGWWKEICGGCNLGNPIPAATYLAMCAMSCAGSPLGIESNTGWLHWSGATGWALLLSILSSSVALHLVLGAPAPSVQLNNVFSVFLLHAPPPCRNVTSQWLPSQFALTPQNPFSGIPLSTEARFIWLCWTPMINSRLKRRYINACNEWMNEPSHGSPSSRLMMHMGVFRGFPRSTPKCTHSCYKTTNPILIHRLPHTSLPVLTPNTIHHSRLTVCLPDSLDLTLFLSILF